MKLSLEPILSLTPELEQDLEKMGLSSHDIQHLDLEHHQQRYFTATFNGKHVAFVAFEHLENAGVNQIKRFIVHPATRRRGVGRFVVEQLLERVSGGFECDFARVQADNKAVAELFFKACEIKAVMA